MHCLDPSCVSACIVGALTKAPDGAVVYNPTICIGCRYCQVACPFESAGLRVLRAAHAARPEVRVLQRPTKGTGADPACAASCPTEALVFGRRRGPRDAGARPDRTRPDRYVDHVYGEHEVGGTSWLYLTGRPVAGGRSPDAPDQGRRPNGPRRSSTGSSSTASSRSRCYGLLAGIMWCTHRKHPEDQPGIGEVGEATTAETKDGENADDAATTTIRIESRSRSSRSAPSRCASSWGSASRSASRGLLLGLGRVTNLDNHSPWGIWISFDVACGVALAAGGFTTAALVDIFGRRRYGPCCGRPSSPRSSATSGWRSPSASTWDGTGTSGVRSSTGRATRSCSKSGCASRSTSWC